LSIVTLELMIFESKFNISPVKFYFSKLIKLILIWFEIVIHIKNIKYYYWRNYIIIDISKNIYDPLIINILFMISQEAKWKK